MKVYIISEYQYLHDGSCERCIEGVFFNESTAHKKRDELEKLIPQLKWEVEYDVQEYEIEDAEGVGR